MAAQKPLVSCQGTDLKLIDRDKGKQDRNSAYHYDGVQETKGRISGPNGAALHLGVKRSTLLDRMKKLGINPRDIKIRYGGSYDFAGKRQYALA